MKYTNYLFIIWSGAGIIHERSSASIIGPWQQTGNDGSIIIPGNKRRHLCKVGDWIIISPDGWYYDDAEYLPRFNR